MIRCLLSTYNIKQGVFYSQTTHVECVALLKNVIKKELEKKTNLSKSTIDRTISNLKDRNIIKRIGANKNGYWEIVK